MLQGKFHSQVGGIKEVQPLGKRFYQIVLEDKDSATNLKAVRKQVTPDGKWEEPDVVGPVRTSPRMEGAYM